MAGTEAEQWTTPEEALAWLNAQVGDGVSGSIGAFRDRFAYQDGVCQAFNEETGEFDPTTVEDYLSAARGAWADEASAAQMIESEARSAEAMYWDCTERDLARYGMSLPRSKRTEDCSICRGGGCPACCPEDHIRPGSP